MKVQLLLLEGVEKEMQEDLMNQLNQKEQLSQYDKVLAELEGREIEQKPIYIDVRKFFKTTDFYFKKEDVKGLFMSTKLTVSGDKIMIIIIDNDEYECLFDEVIFEELKKFLNN